MATARKPSAAAMTGIVIGIVSLSLFVLVLVLACAFRQRKTRAESRQQQSVQSEEAGIHKDNPCVATLQEQNYSARLYQSAELAGSGEEHFLAPGVDTKVSHIILRIGDKKNAINLKQLLGLDDATLLRSLSSQRGQPFHLTVAPVYFTAPLRVAANGVEPATNKQDVKEHIGPRNLDNTSNKPGSSTPGTVLPDNNGINPWDLDIQPNPVMFPHLATPIPSRPSGQFIRSHYNDDDNTIPEWLQKAREVRMVGPDFTPNSYSCVAEELHMTAELIDSTVKFQTMESWSSEDTAYSWASTAITAVDDEWREISPATSISSTPDLDKGKGLLAGLVDTVPLANFVAATPEPTVSDIAKRSSFEMKQYQVPDIEKLSHGGLEAIEIIATETLIPLPAPEESLSTDSQYSCPKCNLHFRTPGLRRNHQNRKHNPRYICPLCNTPFGLRADLERHKVTKHSNDFQPNRSKVYQCPNDGCATPGKEYYRKDNFKKHVKRCEKAILRGRANEKRGMVTT